MESQSTIIQFFTMMGPYRWPMLLITTVILVLVLKKAIDLYIKKDLGPAQQKKGLNTILFWGVFCAVFGIFAQTMGLWEALNAIMNASDLSPAMVLIGFLMSFITTAFGLGVLLVSALFWWLFSYRIKTINS